MGKITRRIEKDGATRYVHWEMVSPYDELLPLVPSFIAHVESLPVCHAGDPLD